jgi:hypothetical protein
VVAAVAAAITCERSAPAGERFASIIGAISLSAALVLLSRVWTVGRRATPMRARRRR